jgi:hypothetical protein
LIFAVTQAPYSNNHHIKSDEFVAAVGEFSNSNGKRGELPLKDYPIMVTVSDIRDPKTFEQLNPMDLATYFGPDVRLKRISVEVIDEKVTTGVEKRLTWLADYYSKRHDGQHFGDGLGFDKTLSSAAISTRGNR